MLLLSKWAAPSAVQLTRLGFTCLRQLCPHCLEVKLKFPAACGAGTEPAAVALCSQTSLHAPVPPARKLSVGAAELAVTKAAAEAALSQRSR